jgi:hypothetical protein
MGDGMEMVLIVVMLFYLGLGVLMFSPFILLHMLLEAIFKKPSPPPPPPVKQPRRSLILFPPAPMALPSQARASTRRFNAQQTHAKS